MMNHYLSVFLMLAYSTCLAQSKPKQAGSKPDTLKSDVKNIKLNEVIIKAKRPLIEMGIDKTTVNVSAMTSSAGSNTLEVLEKTPGITVDARGNISLNGRNGVMILIDGRQTYLSGPDLANYLKSLPGANLDKIELMDNPPAKYDAAGNGVIHIRLKKNRIGGLTGSVSTGYTKGRLSRSSQALNLNYNHKKINIFSNIGYSNSPNYSKEHFDRRFYNDNAILKSTLQLDTREQARTDGGNINLGADYAASPATNFVLQMGSNWGKRRGFLDSYSKTYSLSGLNSIGNGHIDYANDSRNQTGNVTMLHKLNNTGTELSAEAGYLKYRNIGNATAGNQIFSAEGQLSNQNEILYDLPNVMEVYTMRSDFLHTFTQKINIEAGIKWSKARNDHLYNSHQLHNGAWVIDNTRSNHFIYTEDNLAAYLSGQKSWKNWGLMLGLRAEHTHADGVQLGNTEVAGSRLSKKYIELFPSLFINHKLDTNGTNSFTFSLTRRINRPNYNQLNPFLYYVDQYSFNSGNAELDPQYQYRYELKYQYKQLLRIGLSYNHFTQGIFNTTDVVEGIYYSKPENIHTGYMVLLSTWIAFDPTKWWNLNSDILLSRIGLNGQVNGQHFMPETYVARINLMNRLELGKGWHAEVGSYYASRDMSGQAFTAGRLRTNAGLQKKLWKDKCSIRLHVDDIFHSWIDRNSSVGLRQSSYYQTREIDSRLVGLALTYSFGNELFKRKTTQKNSALDEEKSRM